MNTTETARRCAQELWKEHDVSTYGNFMAVAIPIIQRHIDTSNAELKAENERLKGALSNSEKIRYAEKQILITEIEQHTSTKEALAKTQEQLRVRRESHDETFKQLESCRVQLTLSQQRERELVKDGERKRWLLSQCKVVHFIRDEANDLGNYPVEHHPLVGKQMIDDAYIDQAIDKAKAAL
jgi:hypothetical protein